MSINFSKFPHKWFPETRNFNRKIFFHSGPTNSGKTFNCINKLLDVKTCVYGSPLKLLANEIYYKMIKNDKCNWNLVTGEEKKGNIDSLKTSCTIEMLDRNRFYEIAIIVI